MPVYADTLIPLKALIFASETPALGLAACVKIACRGPG